jgi:hypothetical protein
MRTRILIALFVSCSFALLANAQLQPLTVKYGLWEVTSTHAISGMPAVNIPPEVLAKMPAEQRARMEAMTKGSGATTQKICITKEKMEKSNPFREQRKECTYTIVSSSSTKLEEKFQCVQQDTTMNGTVHVEVLSPESTKTTVHTVMTGKEHNMNADFNITSRYLGSACGDVK